MSFLVELLKASDDRTREAASTRLNKAAAYRGDAGEAIRAAVAAGNGRPVDFKFPRSLPASLRLSTLVHMLDRLPWETAEGLIQACSDLVQNGDKVAPKLEAVLRRRQSRPTTTTTGSGYT
jgi:hypothetical protein